MTGRLVLENLKHRPMRSLLSILLIAVPVTLILALVGLSYGMLDDAQQRARGSGADIMVRGTNASSLLSASLATLPEKFLPFFEKQPHVRLAMGVITHAIEMPLTVTGVDVEKFSAMSGVFHYLEGGPFQQPNDMIIDRYYAAQRHVRAGETLTVMNRPWHVCGIIEGGKLSHILVPLKVLQELDSSSGLFSQIYLKLDDSANTAAVIADLKRKLGPAYPIYSMEEIRSMLSVDTVPGLRPFIGVIEGVGVIIGLAVVCLSMYMAVLQRTREIGILKSLGASKVFILRIIMAEALLLGAGGTVLGIAMSYVASWIIQTVVPASIQMVIVHQWWPIAGANTLASAALGALYPGLSAARHDPIEALAYE